jgi:Methyltransferase FkbM domain
MNYDFVEIGTANFGTAIEEVDDTIVGLAMDPLQNYLDMLPNPKNVTKVCGALVSSATYEKTPEMEVFYVPHDDIVKNNLDWWLAGCNSIGHPHSQHKNIMNLVKTKKVKCYTFEMLAKEFTIDKIGYVQIDTEGHDVEILNGMLDYYEKYDLMEQLPDLVKYESNQLNEYDQLKQIGFRLTKLGYSVVLNPNGENTVATKATPKFIPRCFY